MTGETHTITDPDVNRIKRKGESTMNHSATVPMGITDLENFECIFSMTIAGIEEHLTHDKLRKAYVIDALLGLDRHLQAIIKDLSYQAHLQAKEALAGEEALTEQ